MRELLNACKRDKASGVASLLKAHPKDFDLTYDEGICLFFAMQNNNVEMLTSLLDYYDQKELQGDYFSDRKAQIKLVKILKDNSDHPLVKLSPEIDAVIKSYESKAIAVEDDDGSIIPDYYDEGGTDEGRDSKESAHHSEDILPFTEDNIALLGDRSAVDSDSSEEGS